MLYEVITTISTGGSVWTGSIRAAPISCAQAQAVVSGSSVFQNGRTGINILDADRVTIENNRIYKNSLAGVRILGSVENEKHKLQVRIAGNKIYLNQRAGIRAMLV